MTEEATEQELKKAMEEVAASAPKRKRRTKKELEEVQAAGETTKKSRVKPKVKPIK